MGFRTACLKAADRTLGAALCAALARTQRAPERRTLAELPPEGRLLAIRPGGLGDAVLLLPALRALRAAAPGRALDVVCESRNAATFRLAGIADRIFEFDAHPVRTLAALRRGPWAAVVDSEQFHRFSAVFAALTRAPIRVGFSVNPARLALYTHLVSYDTRGPERDQFARLVGAPGLGVAAAGTGFETTPAGADFAAAGTGFETRLRALGVPGSYVLCHAGGSVAAKRWPAASFAAFCRAVVAEIGLPCVLTGGRDDVKYANEISACWRRYGHPVPPPGAGLVDLTGRLSLAETAAACRGAAAVVGPDSGIAHVAAAVGTKAVVLFGPSDPEKWGPPPGGGEVVRVGVPCSPCSVFGATKPCRGRDCMVGIAPARVLAALRRALA